MPNRKTHLGEAELEIMQILWSARQPQTVERHFLVATNSIL